MVAKSKSISLFLTVLVVAVLFMAGPSTALTLQVGGGTTVTKGTDISLLANIIIEAQERVPISQNVLTIYGPVENYTCIFSVDGDVVSGCNNLTISILSNAPYTNGTTLVTGYAQGSYGYGYGYGFGYGGVTNEQRNLTYNITIDTDAFPASFSNYTVQLRTDLSSFTPTSFSSELGTFAINAPAAEADEVIPDNETTDVEVTNTTNTIVFVSGSAVRNITINNTVNESKQITLDFSNTKNSTGAVSVTNELNLTRVSSSNRSFKVKIPASTVLEGGSAWNGTFVVPTIQTTLDPTGTSRTVIKVGSVNSSQRINLSQPVEIVIPGETGSDAFWSDGTTATQITRQCNSATDASNVPAGGECYFDDGTDLIIWTRHFTEFGAYDAPASSSGSSGSGGGSSGSRYYFGGTRAAEKPELTAYVDEETDEPVEDVAPTTPVQTTTQQPEDTQPAPKEENEITGESVNDGSSGYSSGAIIAVTSALALGAGAYIYRRKMKPRFPY